MAWKSSSAYKSMSFEDRRIYDETRYRAGLREYTKHLRTAGGLHDRPSDIVRDRLWKQGDDYCWENFSPGSRVRIPPIQECAKCRAYGFHSREAGESRCFIGCVDCVRENGWCWGEFLRPAQYGIPEPNPDAPSDWIKIPCNGIREGHDAEMTNLEVILMLLNEVWDTHPDHDPPKWRDFFNKAPNHLHMVVCESMALWTSPDIMQDWDMEPGHYMVFQSLYSAWTEEQTYGGEYEVEDTETTLQPRELFPETDSDDRDRDTRRQLCREGQALLDNGEEFNEEKYRQLCNLFMKIHQA